MPPELLPVVPPLVPAPPVPGWLPPLEVTVVLFPPEPTPPDEVTPPLETLPPEALDLPPVLLLPPVLSTPEPSGETVQPHKRQRPRGATSTQPLPEFFTLILVLHESKKCQSPREFKNWNRVYRFAFEGSLEGAL